MNDLYGEQHKQLQQDFDTEKLAERVKEFIVLPEIADEHKAFIESRDMFFLTTIDLVVTPPAPTKAEYRALLK